MRYARSVGCAAIWVASAVLGASCDGSSDPEPDAGPQSTGERERQVLASLAANVILPAYRDFATAAAALESAAAAHASDRSEANRTAVQAAWIAAMDAWQRCELLQLGPAGMSGTLGVVGGMNLRDEVYSFPETSTCSADRNTVEQNYADPDAFAARLVNVRGLDTLEYLLFVESTDNTCTPATPINADGTWAALGEAEIIARRAAYAHTLAILVRRQADALVAAWAPEGEDFAGELARAGDGSALFPTAQRALNDVAGAMIYLDTMTKDMKLGEPAGILRCTTDTCLDQLESRWAGRSRAHVLINLDIFSALYFGGAPESDALGFDDLLREMGAEDLAGRIAGAIAAAVAAVEALDADLETAITTDAAGVMAAYEAIGLVARLFKTELVTVLDIELPANFGDND